MPRNKEQSEQMREESRQKILATAQRLFAERGYDGCSVADIAREAGMSQGNIYWYFQSKSELLAAVLSEGFHVLGGAFAQAALEAESGAGKLRRFLDRFDALMRDTGGQEFITIVMSLIAQGGVQRFADLGLSTRDIGASYHSSLDAIISQAQQEGAVMQGVEPGILSAFLFAFINGLVMMYPDEWREIPPDQVRYAVLRLLGSSSDEVKP